MRRRHRYAMAFASLPVAFASSCGPAKVDAPKVGEATMSAGPTTTTTEDAWTVTTAGAVVPDQSDGATGADGASDTSSPTPSTTSTPTSRPESGPTTLSSGVPVRSIPSPPSADGGTAVASWYGDELRGNPTANGEPYDPDGLTFAHKSMAFGTLVRFCGSLGCVVARCNDRGPFVAGRTFDLSEASFAAVAPLGAGVTTVTWSVVG